MEICEIYLKRAAHDELIRHGRGDGVEGTWGYQLEEKEKKVQPHLFTPGPEVDKLACLSL